MARPRPPAARDQTLRQALLDALRAGPATARDLSGLIGISEKDVPAHLEHLQRSLRHGAERLVVEPACCTACGYTFSKRRKLTRPSACPNCRAQRIEPPVFHVEAVG